MEDNAIRIDYDRGQQCFRSLVYRDGQWVVVGHYADYLLAERAAIDYIMETEEVA